MKIRSNNRFGAIPIRAIGTAFFLLMITGAACYYGCSNDSSPKYLAESDVRKACGVQCHRFPPPDVLPKSEWRNTIYKMCKDITAKGGTVNGVSVIDCILWYEHNAPEAVPISNADARPGIGDIKLKEIGLYSDYYKDIFYHDNQHPAAYMPDFEGPGVSNVCWAKLGKNDKTLKLIVCDMANGAVVLFDPMKKSGYRFLAHIPNPAHATVVDLDKDGIPDILVANMGTFTPSDSEIGSVEWLRGMPDGSYKQYTLLSHLPRPTDIEAADFDGDGDLDLVVSCFGLQKVGEIIYLENKTTDWDHPNFVPRMLDPRPGAIHVPVCDLNHDGKPDFVALISQQFETIVAFINKGNAQFEEDTIYMGPHPHWGSSGIQLVDMDGDGDLDVLYTNGDILDDHMMKPYHGVQWLENKGTFPFTYHAITHFNGCERAVAADINGDGKMDIVASSFLPLINVDVRRANNLESVIWLENTGNCNFVRHSIEMYNTGHASLDIADYDNDGKPDIAVGNFSIGKSGYEVRPAPIVTIWHNETKFPAETGK